MLLTLLLVCLVGSLIPARVYAADVELSAYSSSNRSGWLAMKSVHPSTGSQESAMSQSFMTPDDGNTYTLTKVLWTLLKTGSPTGNAYAKLYAHSGTFGTSSVPSGSALATSTALDVSTISGSGADYNFTFTDAYEMSANTAYVVTYEEPSSGITTSNYISGGYDSTAPTHAGNVGSYDSAGWTPNSGVDAAGFAVYGELVSGGPQEVSETLTATVRVWSSLDTELAVSRTVTGLIRPVSWLDEWFSRPATLTGTIATYGSLSTEKALTRLFTASVYPVASLDTVKALAFLLASTVNVWAYLHTAIVQGGIQELAVTLYATIMAFGSLDKDVSLSKRLTQTVRGFASLTHTRLTEITLTGLVAIYGSLETSKDVFRTLGEVVTPYAGLITEMNVGALTVILYEAVSAYAGLVTAGVEALTVDDVYGIAALALILALVAIALVVVKQRQ